MFNLRRRIESLMGCDSELKENISILFAKVKDAAELGDRGANAILGYWFETGWNVDIEIDKAVAYYTRAAQRGSGEAAYNLGRIHYVNKDYKKAIHWLQMAANCSEGQAFALLGFMSEMGYGTVRDLQQAISYYFKGLELRNRDAGIHLASCAQRGFLTREQCAELIEGLKSTLVIDQPQGWFELGLLLLRATNLNTRIPDAQILEPFEKAASLGDVRAMVYCAELYCMETGTTRYFDKGLRHLDAALEKGSTRAKYLKAVLLATGTSIPKDPAQAFMLCEQAAKEGDRDAMKMLGLMLVRGHGVKKNVAHGNEWLARAELQSTK